jgi:hypothetical protein
MKSNGDLKKPLSFDFKNLTHKPLILKNWKIWCNIDSLLQNVGAIH